MWPARPCSLETRTFRWFICSLLPFLDLFWPKPYSPSQSCLPRYARIHWILAFGPPKKDIVFCRAQMWISEYHHEGWQRTQIFDSGPHIFFVGPTFPYVWHSVQRPPIFNFVPHKKNVFWGAGPEFDYFWSDVQRLFLISNSGPYQTLFKKIQGQNVNTLDKVSERLYVIFNSGAQI